MKPRDIKSWCYNQWLESQSDINKYYYWEKKGCEGNSDQLFLFYALESSGARDFYKKHKEEME